MTGECQIFHLGSGIPHVLVLHFCSVRGQRGQRCSYVLSPSAASSLGVSFNLLEPLTQTKL